MTQVFRVHPDNPQQRLIVQAVDILKRGGVVVYPTDSAYALGACLGFKKAVDRIRDIRQLEKHHNFTLVCRDLSELATYAKVDNPTYRLLKASLPGPYTFILRATASLPRLLLHPKRRTIGIRVPNCNISSALLTALEQPLLSTTLILPGNELPLSDMEDIEHALGSRVDLIIDGGYCGLDSTTVVSVVDGVPEVIRQGKAKVSFVDEE